MSLASLNQPEGQPDNVAPEPRAPERLVYFFALLVFAGAAAATFYFNRSMSGGGMPMPGHWTMSMMWMAMPGQALFISGLVFTAMWLAMMVAMMLPSSMPMLLLYRRAAAFRAEAHLGWATFSVAAGYFVVWTVFGIIAYLAGVGISRSSMQWEIVSRMVPLAGGVALMLAGIYQLTPLKFACLSHCRDPLALVAHHLHGGWRGALRLGLHHGVFCAACCWGLMLIQLVLGIMNLGIMVAVALVIALEKLLSHGEWVARATGIAAIAGGIAMTLISIRSF